MGIIFTQLQSTLHWPPPQGTSVFIQLSLLLVQTALLCDVSDHNNVHSILRSIQNTELFMQNLIWEALQNILILESHQIRLVWLLSK